MNRKQKVVIWLGALLIVAMGVYPPWVKIGNFDREATRLQARQYVYGWIFHPPPAAGKINEADSGNLAEEIGDTFSWIIQLDLARLLVQWATVCFAVAGAVWALKRARCG